MKPSAIIGVVALNVLFSCIVSGQATFQFQNLFPIYGIDAAVFDTQGIPLSGADYRAELYGGTAQNMLTPALNISLQRVAEPFFTGAFAGYFQSANSVAVFEVPPGGSAWLQVRAWDTRLGATYEEVAAIGLGGYGESPLFYAAGGNPGPNPTLPGPLIGLESFSLREVPEPSTWALLVCGGFGVWWRARRHTAHARNPRQDQ